ncbi:MAG: hypothetical protein HQ567_16900 [Candidatus Nealsonbacteria bacterium]|nr:hypothetical protein [Candidatus Nealsonbacteria bacterium]
MISTPKHYRCGRASLRSAGFLLILLGPAGLFCGTAMAQPDPANPDDWFEVPPDETLSRQGTRARQMAIGGFSSAADRTLYEDYYKKYDLRRWTLVENRAELAGYRRQLQIDLRNSERTAAVHELLSKIVFDFMTILSGDRQGKDFHPASRVNAMLMIGELNDKEAGDPTPKAAALPVLTKAVNDPGQLDAVRAAAMVGVVRHGKRGAIGTGPARSAVGRMALTFLATPIPAGRTADGHAWMQGQAAEILGLLGAVDAQGSEAKRLAVLVLDTKLPFSTRCIAAEAMGKLNYAAFAPPSPSKVAAPFGQLALDACNTELSGRRKLSQNHLKVCLTAAANGLNGVDSLATSASDRKFVDGLKSAIGALLGFVTDSGLTDDELTTELNDEKGELVQLKDLMKPVP